ncbi:hypothetical protein [Saccharothrix hoggarensis]|uniref:Uncharacterized protein n=1 Tax=Saccharothrix hoggarensis TaxID=913853 RepID=A0ABW3QMN3_9PSEU
MDFELMKYMGWSWPELEATPEYVRRFAWDLMQIKLTAENGAREREIRSARDSGP